MIKNNCENYRHADGYPMPETSSSCRGCANSYDPNLYDPGCPDGFRARKLPIIVTRRKNLRQHERRLKDQKFLRNKAEQAKQNRLEMEQQLREQIKKLDLAAPTIPADVETR